MHTYICIYLNIYMNVYVYIFKHIYECIRIYILTYIYECIYPLESQRRVFSTFDQNFGF